jgi:hypothetical protein
LGDDLREFARSLGGQAAPRREHYQALFAGLGSTLWERTPKSFQDTYRALRSAYGAEFEIQLVLDDPYVPWELMLPDVDGARPLFVDHPVARWSLNYRGSMKSRIQGGPSLSCVPTYDGEMRVAVLQSAQMEGQLLRTKYAADPLPPYRKEVLEYLRGDRRVGLFHFAGHGRYVGGPAASEILLDDGPLNALEVKGTYRTGLEHHSVLRGALVLFNACESGRSEDFLGASNGWPEAFAHHGVGGLIAPLWPVYDQHAFEAISDILSGALEARQPPATVLRNLRRTHENADSPSYLSYLFFGDVMARLSRSP